MICKLANIAGFCCMLLLVSACQQKASMVPISYKQDFPIDTALSVRKYEVESLMNIYQIERLGDRVLAFGDYGDVGIFSYPDMKFVCKTALPTAASITTDSDCLYCESGGMVDAYVLKEDSLHKSSSFTIAKTPSTILTVQELKIGVYIYPDMYDYPGIREFHMMDIKNRKCTSKGNYPEDESRFKRLKDFKLAYAHSLRVKPDKSAFVVIYGQIRRIRIYNSEGELFQDLFIEESYGNYKVVPVDFSERYGLLSQVVTTDKYIYILNKDQPLSAPVAARSNILVLDWQGNLIAKYRFNLYIYSFFIDEKTNLICGVCREAENELRFFEMEILN